MFSKFSKTMAAASGVGGSSSSSPPNGGGNNSANSSVASTPIGGTGGLGSNGTSNGAVLLEGSSLAQQFEVGKLVATAGPCHIWKIYEGYRKSDAKEVSVFIFEKKSAEKIHKPRRKETVTELLRYGIRQLERHRHPRLLQVLAGPEDSTDTLSFYSEPIYGSLANIITPLDEKEKDKDKIAAHKDYSFLEVELKYGILQITEALSFLHYTCHVIHRNVTPLSVFVTKKGTWKLAGLEFTEKISDSDSTDSIPVQPWTSKASKLTQPDLDFIAPESQQQSQSSALSDMYSLGLVMCAIFNEGKSLVEANHSSSLYNKQIETLPEEVSNFLPKLPLPMQEVVSRLVNKDIRQRPTAQLVALIKFLSDPIVQTLQFLDVINMKDPSQKSHFYRATLIDVLPLIPKKLWFLHVWPSLQQEMRTQESLAAALQPILKLISEITVDEYENIILPHFRSVFTLPKSIQATVTLLENINVILEKTPEEDVETDILPIVFAGLESNTVQVQIASLKACTSASKFIEPEDITKRILPRCKSLYENSSSDVSLCITVLSCIEKILDKLERSTVIDDILPILYDIKLQDAEVTVKVVNIYRLMLSDKKLGLSINQMANRVLPSLLPLTVSPTLNLEQFNFLMNTIHEMLDMIDKQQRNKLKLDNLSLTSPGTGPSSPDSHLLRVQSSFIGRRLSDNELMMPPKIRIAHSSSAASSPGEGGSLPYRRHSSTLSERRGSGSAHANLSPPTGAAINSRSVPMLLTPGSGSNINSRRPSVGSSIGSFGGFDSRRSSIASISSPLGTPSFKTSRRPSALLTNHSSGNLLQQFSSGVVSTYQMFSGK